MENTRTKIIEILRRRQEATVDELTQALSLAPATIRRHLDILQRDGYITVRPVRRETGRPHYAFSLTEAGEDLFPQHYVRVANRLIEEIVALDPDETSGRSGQELAGLIFERMADRLARTYGPRISGRSLGDRVEQVASVLSNEGIVFDVVPRDDGFVLLGRSCPCRRVAEQHPDMCSHDQHLLSRLLGTEVEPTTATNDAGETYCAYFVHKDATPALSG